MNTSLKSWSVGGFIAIVFLSSAALAAGGNRERGGSALSPSEAPQFKPGDILTIAAGNANLMRGDRTIATVPKGQPVVVVEVRGQWVGIYVSIDGQKRTGWMRTTDFVPASAATQPGSIPTSFAVMQRGGPEVILAAESKSYAPPAPSPAGEAQSGQANGYFRAYYTGYYTRHETDPNLEVWEPWRYR